MARDRVRRAFVDIEHGQIHCRIAGDLAADTKPPLLMLHGGPGSSAGLLPVIKALAERGFCVIAPDLMGNGQSDPPPREPDMAFYVECTLMVLDQLGVKRVDIYGHHFGAQLACEIAIRAAERIQRLMLDGIGLFPIDRRREFLAKYAPAIEPDAQGEHLARLWRFLSATTVRFPHYSEAEEHRIAGGAALPPPVLTDQFADVVRNWRTYHLTYRVSFAEDFGARLKKVEPPAKVFEVDGDPLARYAKTAGRLLKSAQVVALERTARADTIAQILCDENL